MQQLGLLDIGQNKSLKRPLPGLLKWIGNKSRTSSEIVSFFPDDIHTYYEPFLGSGAVLGTLQPSASVISDTFSPLIAIWKAVKRNPESVKEWYRERWERIELEGKKETYESVRDSYNRSPNGPDFLFLSRACYGGVIRFRKADGYMSTPCGVHDPMRPEAFEKRVDAWHRVAQNSMIIQADYKDAMALSQPNDFIYCDPPYSDSQSILYGAQSFQLSELFKEIGQAKSRGVRVALSIDGRKSSDSPLIDLDVPQGLFEREILISTGRSMLKRLQMVGESQDNNEVVDRLLLTY